MKAIPESAIEKRIKRKLAHRGETLVKMRVSTPYYNYSWPYCIVNDRNHIVYDGLHLAELARELGVLSADEYVEGWEEQSC